MPGRKGLPAGLDSIEKPPSHNRALNRHSGNLCGRKDRRKKGNGQKESAVPEEKGARQQQEEGLEVGIGQAVEKPH